MNLEQVVIDLAAAYDIHPGQLLAYADEDTAGGWDLGQGEWPTGSIWSVEGKILYALIRATRPQVVLELGTYAGCSTLHILKALEANGGGRLIAVDANMNTMSPGTHLPEEYKGRIEAYAASAVDWLKQRQEFDFDFIFEDLDHSEDTTRQVWELAQKVITPGGFILSHDATHPLVGSDIVRGIHASGAEGVRLYSIEPSDCGLAIYRDSRPIQRFEGFDTVIKEGYIDTKAEVAAQRLSTPVETPKVTPPKRTRPKAKPTRTRKTK